MAIDLPLRLPQHWLGSSAPKGKGPNNPLRAFVNSVMSYTKMDVPTVELFETAVTFDAKHRDPLSAHQCLSKTFGKKAGVSFVFRADTASEGRYWVYSADPWLEPPAEAISALAPKRIVHQLCEGLPYRFALDACVGREKLVAGEKEVEPFRTPQEVEAWIKAVGPKFGFKPDFFNVDDQRTAVSVRRSHRQVAVRVDRRSAAGHRRGPDEAAAVAWHRFVPQSRLGIAAAIQLVASQHSKTALQAPFFICSRRH